MKFEICSAYSPTWTYIPKVRDYISSLNCYEFTITKEEDSIYIECEKLIELDLLLTLIPEELYDNTGGWKPRTIVINFEGKKIILCDYWLA